MINSDQKVLVAGHSFISRLSRWIEDQQEVVPVVGGRQVYFCGASGEKVLGLERSLEAVMRGNQYTCVVLEIGSNDLCSAKVTAEVVAGGIYQLAKTLQETYNVNSVVMFEILNREEGCRYSKWMEVSLEEYNQRVQSVNETLRGWCERVAGITFRTHKREAKRLDDDGVHIRPVWMKHYWRSVEQAIMAHLSS